MSEPRTPKQRTSLARRPFLGILFDCCGVYSRAYRTRDAKRYEGRCPRCLRSLTIRIDSGGEETRFFRAS